MSASAPQKNRSLTLLLPDLLWPEPAQEFATAGLALPGLLALLTPARHSRHPVTTSEMALAAQFPASGLTLAALRRLGESLSADDRADWLCADPAQLHLHQECIVLADASSLELAADEIAAVIADLNRNFADLGEFSAPHPQRWYLRCRQPLPAALPPLSAAAGRTLAASLPQHPTAAPLRQLLNELQMFLHAHPVNSERAAAGRPTLNALWPWGSEIPAGSRDQNLDAVYGNDPLTRGLAATTGLVAQPLPANFAALPVAAGSSLLYLDALQLPARHEDVDAWQAAMQRLESDWFAPLAGALSARQIKHLTLIAPCAHGCHRWQKQTPSALQALRNRFTTIFHRPRPRALADWSKDLA